MIFLEDIHVFALSNLLARPIVVLGMESIADLDYNRIRGIYLPLSKQPFECVKDPIVLAFHSFHFFSMQFGVDWSEILSETSEVVDIKYNEKFFFFDKVNFLKDDNRAKAFASLKQKKYDRLLNILPLVCHKTLKKLKAHFLNENENYFNLIEKYLNVTYIRINVSELGPGFVDFENQESDVACCYLSKDSHRIKKNAFSSFLDYISQ